CILACLETLVVRYPSFTWNPFHHSAHLPGSAVHLVGPNRTRIGGGRPSIYGISFRWRRRRGQIDHRQTTRAPGLGGWIPGGFPAPTAGPVFGGLDPRLFPPPHQWVPSLRRPRLDVPGAAPPPQPLCPGSSRRG